MRDVKATSGREILECELSEGDALLCASTHSPHNRAGRPCKQSVRVYSVILLAVRTKALYTDSSCTEVSSGNRPALVEVVPVDRGRVSLGTEGTLLSIFDLDCFVEDGNPTHCESL